MNKTPSVEEKDHRLCIFRSSAKTIYTFYFI